MRASECVLLSQGPASESQCWTVDRLVWCFNTVRYAGCMWEFSAGTRWLWQSAQGLFCHCLMKWAVVWCWWDQTKSCYAGWRGEHLRVHCNNRGLFICARVPCQMRRVDQQLPHHLRSVTQKWEECPLLSATHRPETCFMMRSVCGWVTSQI